MGSSMNDAMEGVHGAVHGRHHGFIHGGCHGGCPWTVHVINVEHRSPINVNKHSSSRYVKKIMIFLFLLPIFHGPPSVDNCGYSVVQGTAGAEHGVEGRGRGMTKCLARATRDLMFFENARASVVGSLFVMLMTWLPGLLRGFDVESTRETYNINQSLLFSRNILSSKEVCHTRAS